MNNHWDIREPRSTDIPFIYANFLNSYHYDSWTKSIQKSVFFNNYKKVVDHLLHISCIKVACLPENDNTILGFIIYEEPETLHYIYVKDAFRRFGIATSLFNEAFEDPNVTVSHRTNSVVNLMRSKPNLSFNPFVLYHKEE